MEKKKVSIKLFLNKKSVTTFSNQEMGEIKGGIITATVFCQTKFCSIESYTRCCPTNEQVSCCDNCSPV